MSDDPKQSSDGPTLATLVVLGFFMGILIALILLGRNKEFLSALAMTALALVVLCGGFSLNTRGPVRAMLMVFAAIGAGIGAVVICVMK